jgi:4-diphosphocytidyl-2-C-methyl-D-erythritol kinase
LEPISLSLNGYQLVLVNPDIHVSTKEAFAGIHPNDQVKSVRSIMEQPIDTWQDELLNDFEASILPNHPEIARIKQQLLDAGAVYASMSGSGSTVYGIFRGKPGKMMIEDRHVIFQG